MTSTPPGGNVPPSYGPPPPPYGHPSPPAYSPLPPPPGSPTPVAPAQAVSPDTAAADRKLILGGGACIAVSVLSVILRLSGVLPSGLATVFVIMVMAIGLRIFVRYASKSASSTHRARVTKTIALAGLAVSVVTVFASLSKLLGGGGSDHFMSNVFAHLWTIAILLLVVGTARTFNWLALVGMGLTGFLAVTGIAYAVGRPVVTSLGPDNAFAVAVYVPFTEEVLKALPALLILIFAARRRQARPSAVEMALVGAVIGSGFAVYEDSQYKRGGFDFTAMPGVSFLNPSGGNDHTEHIVYANAGHMVHTALIVLGLAVGLLYRQRFGWAKLAIPVTFVAALVEHCTQNYSTLVTAGLGNKGVFDLLRVLTLWGWLSTLLLIAGIAFMAREERRATNNGLARADAVTASFWVKPARAHYAATALARTQLGAAAEVSR